MRLALEHQGRPIEWGAEKEIRFDRFKAGGQWLARTQVDHFDPRVLPGRRAPEWGKLDDAGKAKYLAALRARNPEADKNGDWYALYPRVDVAPGADFERVGFEAGPFLELISPKLSGLGQLGAFTEKYGWGHVHTSFLRGAPPEQQAEMLGWFWVANLYLFLAPLEARGVGTKEDPLWRFNLVGLSVPTVEHLSEAQAILGGEDHQATAFNKHLGLAVRGDGVLYGEKDRIGFETRGGVSAEKRRVLESMLHGLVREAWGRKPLTVDAQALGLVELGPGVMRYEMNGVQEIWQPERVPPDVSRLLQVNLQEAGLDPNAAPGLFTMLDEATLPKKIGSQLGHFDQRVAVPLLHFELLPGLSKVRRAEITHARAEFLEDLMALAKAHPSPRRAGPLIATLIERWAKGVSLAETLGEWLDAPGRRKPFLDPA